MGNIKDIGEIYREAFKDYRIEPSENAWSKLEAKLSLQHEPAPTKKGLSNNGFLTAVASLVLVAVVVFFIGKISEQHESKQIQEKTDKVRSVNVVDNETSNEGNNTLIITNEQQATVIKNNANVEEIKTVSEPAQAYKPVEKEDEKQISQEVNNQTEQIPPESNENSSDKIIVNVQKELDVSETDNTDQEDQEKQIIVEKVAADEKVIEDLPIDPVEFPADQKICKGEEVQLEIKGGVNIKWNNGSSDRIITVYPQVTTIYAVTVVDASQVKHYGDVVVEVYDCSPLFVPNGFTPDGDGLNDVFMPKGTDVNSFKMTIHSRSGNVIFESEDINYGWNGQINGRMAQPGVYFYTISFKDSNGKLYNQNGHITLLR